MIVVYTPKDRDEQRFTADLDDLEGSECELIEEAGGTQWDTLSEWYNLLERGGFRARKALLWVLLQRTNPDLGFEELAKVKPGEVLFAEPEGSDEVGEGKGESGPGASEPDAETTSSASPTPDSAP